MLVRQLGIAAVVDPAPVELVVRRGQVDEVKVQHEVGEAAAASGVAMDDVLEPFDDGDATELHVALHELALVAAVHGPGAEQRQRRGGETLGAIGPGVMSPRLQERLVPRRGVAPTPPMVSGLW